MTLIKNSEMSHWIYSIYGIYLFILLFTISCDSEKQLDIVNKQDYKTWAVVGGDPGVSHYSNLDQINTANAHQLSVAWEFKSGDILNDDNEYWGGSTIQSNPIIVGGVLYSTTPTLHVVALDASSGKLIWRFDPWQGQTGGAYNRGVAYWEGKEGKRIFYTVKNELICLDAVTGKPISSFGKDGRQNMAIGLLKEHEQRGGVISAAAPVIFEDLVIIGGMGEWRVPGNVSAYDVKTGQRRWIFHNIPFPNEYGFESWGDTSYYRTGFGANSWGGLSIDEENKLVFFSTGQAKPDLHRGQNPGDHLFGNCVVALDANSGAYKWHFQEVHHDLWDLDLPCAPMLVDLEIKGQLIPGLIQLSKTGNTYLFHRLTGEIFTEYEEKQVPPSTLPGEYASPTQPWVSWPRPFARQFVTEDEFSNISQPASQYTQKRLQQAKLGWMTPPSLEGNIYYGVHGGAEWPGGAFDPGSQYLFINANQTPWFVKMRRQIPEHNGAKLYAQKQCTQCHGWNRGGFDSFPALTELNHRYNSVDDLIDKIDIQVQNNTSYPDLSSTEAKEIAEFLMDSIPESLIHPGKSLYSIGKCVECHGANREGQGAIPALTSLNSRYEDLEEIKSLIKNGRNAMPGFAGYSDEELTLISKFLMDIPAEPQDDYLGPRFVTDRFERFLDQEGYPGTKPPWGTLSAIDLRSGEIAWQVPLGEYKELSEKGIPVTGTENFGGPIATKGGLIIIGATQDEKIRAFDKWNGKLLWEHSLPAGAYTTPSTYSVDGKQFIIVPCGGGGKLGTPSGDSFIAFSLPNSI